MGGDFDGKRKIPPPRSLDVYRLVVCRAARQVEVAAMFEVSAVRVCQIVSRVRRWVDECVAEWLFPRRDDLRFYAALASFGVEVREVAGEREAVLLVGPGWSYRRGRNSEGGMQNSEGRMRNSEVDGAAGANRALTLSAGAIKADSDVAGGAIGANFSGDSGCMPPHVELLGRRLAELLIEWQKSRPLSGAVGRCH
jgi:hypothetical protein